MPKATEGTVYVPKKRIQRKRKELVFQDTAEAQDYIEAQADVCKSTTGIMAWGPDAKARLIKQASKHGITLNLEALDPNKP